MRAKRVTRLLAVVAVVGFGVAGCSSDPKPFVPAPVAASAVFNFAIIGDSASAFRDGLAYREFWSSQFARDAMPQTATMYTLSGRFNTAGNSVRRSVPLLSTVKPKVVVIWLGFDDLSEQTDAGEYGRDVLQVVQASRDEGAETVLVGTLPDELPDAERYNQELRRSIGDAATIVEMTNVPMNFERVDDRDVPTSESLARIASTFASAYNAARIRS